MLTSSSILLVASLQLQPLAWQVTDARDQFVDNRVRSVRIEGERLRDERPRGDRHLEKIVAYDSTGRMVEQIEYGSEVCIRFRRVYSYDEAGNRNETVSWGPALENEANRSRENVLTSRQSWKWDAGTRSAEIVEYDASGKPGPKTIYRYDENNRVREISESFEATGGSTCRLKYNSLGLVEEERCERGGLYSVGTRTYAYEVDSRGNWVKRTMTETATMGGRTVNPEGRVTYRQIQYSTDNPEKETQAIDRGQAKPCAPLVIRKSGGVFQESASKRVVPVYPPEAKDKKISGSVVVEISTDENGKVISVRSISGPPELREAAEYAARQWEFNPTKLSRVPVRVIGTITFGFNL